MLLEAQRELAHFDRTISTIKTYAKAETGLVRVAAVPSFAITLLPPLLKQFHEQHPQFHLDIRDMDSERVVQAVLSGDVDIGIGTVPASIPNIDQDFLFSDAFCVVCASDNPSIAWRAHCAGATWTGRTSSTAAWAPRSTPPSSGTSATTRPSASETPPPCWHWWPRAWA
ncbi:hypothetical protein PBOI14_10090 [Pseudomonas sp. Boi14]|nr:hypothetical protein PBOI14_10090 [Pseudomonas sp. Boi14]